MVIVLTLELNEAYTREEIFLILDIVKCLVLEYPPNENTINLIMNQSIIYPRILHTHKNRTLLRANILRVNELIKPMIANQTIKPYHVLTSYQRINNDFFLYYLEDEEVLYRDKYNN